MGVYINMKMPETCGKCPCRSIAYGYRCNATGKRFDNNPLERIMSWCPLVPVPPHGRLGDLDKLENGLRHMAKYQHGERQQGILGCCETIRLATTIIEAEEET